MSDSVLLDVHEGVATVTLNEPRIRNALTPALRVAFREVMATLKFDDDVRAVVIWVPASASWQGDIRSMVDRLGMPDAERRVAILEGIHMLHLPLFSIRRMGKPVIASIRAAAGFGVGLVAACDLAIAARSATPSPIATSVQVLTAGRLTTQIAPSANAIRTGVLG